MRNLLLQKSIPHQGKNSLAPTCAHCRQPAQHGATCQRCVRRFVWGA
jgi:hypothetical protein